MRMIISKIAFAVVSLFFTASAAFATSQTPWQDHQGMISTRLLVASPEVKAAFPTRIDESEGTLLLAWEAKLTDGWKTYWRSPGEAGLPVRVFEGEEQVDLLYPVPERFELFGLETYGYSKQVVIPFQLKTTPTGSVTLKADFMVCKDICVPFEASYDLELDTVGNITSDIRVKNWLERVPEKSGAAPDGLEIKSVKLAGLPGRQTLIVDVVAGSPLAKADVLAEGGEAVQFRSPNVRLQGDGRSARFVLPVVSAESGYDLSGKTVRVTLVDGRGHAVERFFDVGSR